MSDESIEQEILEKASTAPSVTIESILNKIKIKHFYQPSGTTLTVCFLVLENGTYVFGESACVSPENFNTESGEKIAFGNAVRKIWALEGYLLKEQLYLDSNESESEFLKLEKWIETIDKKARIAEIDSTVSKDPKRNALDKRIFELLTEYSSILKSDLEELKSVSSK